MAVTTEILRTYRAPRAVMRRLLSDGPREDRAIAFVMAACFVIFIGQWPLASRLAFEEPDIPLQARLSSALLVWVFAMPIFFYGLAGLSHLIAKVVGGQGSYYRARVALFWTLLVISPLMLLRGLVAGFIGAGPELTATDIAVTLAFFTLWFISLSEAERGT
ncbi:YIP1 family protein [Actibacterium sp. 188UL27-1]|uniref:YIP1 family protein n=1 Tax=Actibacterium sp. 188UL27-1 TaxID=2786961 RepID=UPI00195B4404|nr:YIP1 family protein [Actibacterium sp. 188UL27-1]MBM7067533.1 YIP1 family protein [Actibacterium sp. 188UL27-1]